MHVIIANMNMSLMLYCPGGNNNKACNVYYNTNVLCSLNAYRLFLELQLLSL